jgi:VanZ family protein
MKPIQRVFWLYTAAILILAILPINGSDNRINHSYIVIIRMDYLIHAAIFTIWMILYKFAFSGNRGLNNIRQYIPLLGFVSLLALVAEFIQSLIPYRSFNLNDLLANFIGVILGFMLIVMMPDRSKKPLGHNQVANYS